MKKTRISSAISLLLFFLVSAQRTNTSESYPATLFFPSFFVYFPWQHFSQRFCPANLVPAVTTESSKYTYDYHLIDKLKLSHEYRAACMFCCYENSTVHQQEHSAPGSRCNMDGQGIDHNPVTRSVRSPLFRVFCAGGGGGGGRHFEEHTVSIFSVHTDRIDT